MQISMNPSWRFTLDNPRNIEQPEFDDSSLRLLDLPHDWQIEQNKEKNMLNGVSQGFFPRAHIGWYRKKFFVPREWMGHSITLSFDGIQRFSTVYCNGIEVGGHAYGYVPFDCDLTAVLRYGEENIIAVKADNSESEPDRWYSGAGIYRDVCLHVKEPLSFRPRGVIILPQKEGDTWYCTLHTELQNQTASKQNAKLCIEILDNDTVFCCAEQILSVDIHLSSAEYRFAVPSPHLWNPDDPFLYQLKVSLVAGGDVTDTFTTRMGFRTVCFDDDNGFFLNGQSMKLYGGNYHHDGGGFGAAVPLQVWRHRLEELKKIGANTVRCSHNPQCAGFYDLCDELGLLCIDELYDKWTELYYHKFFMEDRFTDLRLMIMRDANHPSIILWSVGNELGIQYQEQFYTLLQEMCDACHILDPTRPVSLALIGFCIQGFNDVTPLETKMEAVLKYSEIVDVFMGNYMENYYKAMREYGMHRAVIGSEVFHY